MLAIRTFSALWRPRNCRAIGALNRAANCDLQLSPRLPDGEAYRLRIWLSRRLGDHALIVENQVNQVCTAPMRSPKPAPTLSVFAMLS
jgi:hypothetical protein